MANKNPNSKRSEKARRKKVRRREAQQERQRLLALGQLPPVERPMSHDEYQEYINSDAWKVGFRNRYLASRMPKACHICDCPWNDGFHLHHLTYKRLGAEWLTDVAAVCESCHDDIHRCCQVKGIFLRQASKRKVLRRFLEQERKAKLAQQPAWMREARHQHNGGKR